MGSTELGFLENDLDPARETPERSRA